MPGEFRPKRPGPSGAVWHISYVEDGQTVETVVEFPVDAQGQAIWTPVTDPKAQRYLRKSPAYEER